MIFSISTNLGQANKITESSFTELDIWERQHIEEWVRVNPEMLGEDLLIVSIEFDRFSNSNDRLDILALDRTGNLVVVELKRDPVAGYADLQALRYAAMVSSMTVELLVPYYIAYRKKYYEEPLSDDEAKEQIIEFVDSDSFAELSNKPRIILCSEGFSQEITATVLWLRGEFNVDISCVKITPYKVDENIVIVPKVIIPLEEAKQYLIDIKRKEEVKEQSGQNWRRTMNILIENNLVREGDEIFLKNDLPSYVEYEEGNPVFHGAITGKLGQSNAVKWSNDGEEYSISGLTDLIFKNHHPEQRSSGALNGNRHWVNSDGKSLLTLAGEYLAENT